MPEGSSKFCQAFNTAFERAEGEIIFRIDDDIKFSELDVANLLDVYTYISEKNSNVGMISCSIVSRNNIYLENLDIELVSSKITGVSNKGISLIKKPTAQHVNKFNFTSPFGIDQESLHHYIVSGVEKFEIYNADRLPGDFWVANSKAVQRVRYDPFFFNPFMCEDLDMSLGMRHQGYMNYFYPYVVVYTEQYPDYSRSFRHEDADRVFKKIVEKYGGVQE